MSEKRRVQGLLDYTVAVTLGEQVSVSAPGAGFAFGNEQAEDDLMADIAASKSKFDETSKFGAPKKKSGGRPKKNNELKADNQRAFLLWLIAQDFPEGLRSEKSVSDLISHMNKNRHFEGQTKKVWEGLTSASEGQSVSRGRTYWEIDENWNSAKLDAFWQKHKPPENP